MSNQEKDDIADPDFLNAIGTPMEVIDQLIDGDTPRSHNDLERVARWCDRTAERVRSMVLTKPT